MSSDYQRARNARDKAQRRIADLKAQLNDTANANIKSRIRKDIKRIQRAVSNTRTYSTKTGKRMHTSKQVARGIDKLNSLLEEFPLKVPRQKNKSFEVRMNMASNKSIQGPTQNSKRTVGEEISGLTKAQVQIFYRATQKAWQNVPVEQRNEAILKYYHQRDLEKLFNDVLSDQRNKDVEKANEILANPDDYTDAERKWAYEVIQDNDDEFRYLPVVSGAVSAEVSPVAPM
jgi:truncated hemoglobin YjbI